MAMPREMIKHQSALVDTCWEEDAYAAAITMLDRLRSTGTKPPVEHVRILTFLALHPPVQEKKKRPPAMKAKGPGPGRGKRRAGRGDEDEALQPPTAAECGAALDLLVAYTMTLAPAHVLRALPCHLPRGEVDPDVDSAVGKRALVLARPKDCADVWAMLRDGFVSDPAGPRDEEDAKAPVGPHAWRVLDWLVNVFEDDGRAWFAQETPTEVPLFLAQIPQQRLSGARNAPLWDTRAPVDVAMYCFELEDADGELPFSERERMALGSRLLHLMIDFTLPKANHPVLLEPANLLRNVLRRLPGLRPSAFDTLLRALVQHSPHFAFTLLCQHFGAAGSPTKPIDVCALLATPPAKHLQAHAKGHLVSALARLDPNAAKNAGLRAAIDRAFAPDMLSPPGVPVDEETTRDAQRWRDQLVLLMDCLGP